MSNTVSKNLESLHMLISSLDSGFEDLIFDTAVIVSQRLKAGGSIYWCGNGGSAAESQHMAAELMGRFLINRIPVSSVSLNSDTSVITCIANDFAFDEIFSRQVNGLAREHDTLVVFSTSGNSENVVQALIAAKQKGIATVAFLGRGGRAVEYADYSFRVPSDDTPRIQEVHTVLGHSFCQIIEQELFGENN
jgi:D-sedoheptulose 7-phosphate isomerase